MAADGLILIAGAGGAVLCLAALGRRLIRRRPPGPLRADPSYEGLAALASDLTRQVGLEEVASMVLGHGVRLLAADGASVALRVPALRVYRVLAVAGVEVAGAGAVVGLEIPEDVPIVSRLCEQTTLVLPEEEPEGAVREQFWEDGERSVLYAVMRHGGEVLGLLSFVRRGQRPFTPHDRALVRALADQAALGLHTATLMTELRLANQLKSQFVSTMSHELRTPLTVILGLAEMARDASIGSAERRECLDRLDTAGRDLLGLIESTLEVGTMEVGHAELRLESVDLPAFWTRLGEQFRRLPRGAAVELEWSADVPQMAVVTDQRKLTIVMRNLVDNALKFTERGTVRAEVRLDGNHVVVLVQDTGIGIPADDQEAVFELFRQADGSDARRYGGTGLGLYVARRFVEQLGGTIALMSHPGVGSVFAVTLPSAHAAARLRSAA